MDIERIVQQIKQDEGFSPKAYFDNDQFTYGYGTRAPHKDATITKVQAEVVLRARIDMAVAEFREMFNSFNIDDVRSEAVVNMLFNLGRTKFSRFRKLIAAIHDRDWGHAAYEAFSSRWFRQLSKEGLSSIERPERIVWELLTGEKG